MLYQTGGRTTIIIDLSSLVLHLLFLPILFFSASGTTTCLPIERLTRSVATTGDHHLDRIIRKNIIVTVCADCGWAGNVLFEELLHQLEERGTHMKISKF